MGAPQARLIAFPARGGPRRWVAAAETDRPATHPRRQRREWMAATRWYRRSCYTASGPPPLPVRKSTLTPFKACNAPPPP